MSKKSLKENNPVAQIISPLQKTQETQTTQEVQKVPDVQAGQNVQASQETKLAKDKQWQKKKKLPRANKVFSKDNLQYLKTVAQIEGVSISEYINRLVTADQANRANELERSKASKKV